jgi:hypothetical protein
MLEAIGTLVPSPRVLVRLGVAIATLSLALPFSLPTSLPFGSAPSSAQGLFKSPAEPAAPKKRPAKKKAAKKPAAKQTAAPKRPAGPPPRVEFTAEEQAAAVIPGIPDARIWGDSGKDFAQVLPQASGPWLALSGGGADGAFSAGVLAGWTEAGNRPEFAVVTGSSIGALIAPYAFLGSRYDAELRDNFTSITAADIFEDRATGESLLDAWPLRRLIEKRMTPELMAAIAVEHRRGRRLLVVTSNLDAGRRVVWNMGAIAERGDDKALKLFRDILLASSTIPGFFAPVGFDVEANGKPFQELHVDGSVTAPFFIAPESVLAGTGPKLPASQVYVIVNTKMAPEFEMPERKLPLIFGRFIAVALSTGLKVELLLTVPSAQKQGFNLNVAYIAAAFTERARGLFDHQYMRALFEFGAEQARKGTAFENDPAKLMERLTGTP